MPTRQRRCFGTIALTFLLAYAAPSCAEKFHGTVTRVIDGDTLILRYLEHHMSVQLEGVDAPDPGESYFRRSAESLAELLSRAARHGDRRRHRRIRPGARRGDV